ncbi:translation initiation factor IF-6 [Candidatus Nitrosocosmicus franklandus]|uniref:Translation initiation factor 6 n=1 Tax=Candidatus Nitrosocosmicus franklandianus TaxID=1798806 RepID=A0A484IA69_9ARCH|nr:translation initiation factor IF-6 [Candidatus Nitrosocosmicus franklandus]VFJ14143.1 Translation initiation factor 6 [Candidatus Nitrosocosmicus franklandus]
MGIFRYDLYKSPNVGIFAKSNDKLVLLPHGYAETKIKKITEILDVEPLFVSIAGNRIIGPMVVLNNNGMILPSTASDDELVYLKRLTGLNVTKLDSKYTAVGNLISSNDKGAIVSPLFKNELDKQISDVLGVEVHTMSIADLNQTGSIVVSTNNGAAVHPRATEEEVEIISSVLKVEVEPLTINGGIPYLSSGMIWNSKSLIVGSLTTGPELIMLSRAFKM